MADSTKIQWTDKTFNPWRGCVKISPGCAHCYAETLSKRNPAVLGEWGKDGVRAVAAESYWRQPLAWARQASKLGVRFRVFCASLADVFEDRPDLVAPRARLFDLIRQTPLLDWQLLTKRPENWQRCLRQVIDYEKAAGRASGGQPHPEDWKWSTYKWATGWLHGDSPEFGHVIPPNVWLGVSVEDQTRADERIPRLLNIPARVRFLSCEPLLGPVSVKAITGCTKPPGEDRCFPSGIHWVIVGGESGHGARPCHVEWVRSLVAECRAAEVAVFVKQLGSRPACDHPTAAGVTVEPNSRTTKGPIPGVGWFVRDHKGGDMEEWPEDLRVRQFPSTEGNANG